MTVSNASATPYIETYVAEMKNCYTPTKSGAIEAPTTSTDAATNALATTVPLVGTETRDDIEAIVALYGKG